MLSLYEEAEQRVRGLEETEVGHFVVGCPDVLGTYFLPSLMRRFLAEAPGIELSLWNGTSRRVQEAVVERVAHFGLVVNPLPHPELVLLELFHNVTALCATREAHPKGRRGRADEARLVEGPLVLVEELPQSQEVLRKLAQRRLLPARRLGCGNLELVKNLTLAGVGVGLLPQRVAAYGTEGRLRRLSEALPSVADTVYLTYRSDLHKTRAALRLKDALKAHGQELALS
jgi:DNA-binding transcriptional LysR family regulator